MEVWLTMPGQKQKTKYRQQLPGILLEAGLILGICGAGIFLLLEMLTGAADRLPFLSSVFFTALFCLFTETMKKGRQITGNPDFSDYRNHYFFLSQAFTGRSCGILE